MSTFDRQTGVKNLLIMAELIQTVSGLVALTAAGHIFSNCTSLWWRCL